MEGALPAIAVLAGGLATRLGDLTKATPKALIDFGGRPFLAWQLELFAERGFREVVLCIRHFADQIEAWVAQHPIPGLTVRFASDGDKALGTGGALRAALPLLGSPFMVTYGDSYLRCDYRDVWRSFEAQRSAAGPQAMQPALGMMTVYENRNQYDASNIVFRGGRILRYDKADRGPEMRHIDYGLGVLTREAFDVFRGEEVFDLARLYQQLLADGRLAGYEVDERFYEVGSFAGIEEFRRLVTGGAGESNV